MSDQQRIGPKWNELFIPDTIVLTEQMEQFSPQSSKNFENEFLKKSTQNEKEIPYSKISNANLNTKNNEDSEYGGNSPNKKKSKISHIFLLKQVTELFFLALARKWKFLLYIFNVFIIVRKIVSHIREKRNLFQFHYSIFQEDDDFHPPKEPVSFN